MTPHEEKMLKSAIWYRQHRGLSVIPMGKNKKPPLKWEQYQKQKPSLEQIQEWWTGEYKGFNIGIVTGEISNLTVVDIDKKPGETPGFEAINPLLPDTLMTPVAKSPSGGEHLYFQFLPGTRNRAGFLPGCDLRSEGGYIVAPPSLNGRGAYSWKDGLSIASVECSYIPTSIESILYNNREFIERGVVREGEREGEQVAEKSNDYKWQRLTTNDYKIIPHTRDDALFHIANALVKGKMPIDEVREILTLIATHGCVEPYPEKDIPIKIQSVLNRQAKQTHNISDDVRELIMTTSGTFTTTNVHNWLQMTTRTEKKTVNQALMRMCNDGIIERVGTKAGTYQRVDTECATIDFMDADIKDELQIVYPLGVHCFVHTLPKSIVVIAGSPDTGKTAMLLNLAALNMCKYKINYFSSEMGALELKTRLQNFGDMKLEDWNNSNFVVKERASDFSSVIGPDDVNIIDFLELHDNFYGVVEHISKIHSKLRNGIAVIALQKKEGARDGRGGEFSKEKARLYMTLDKDYPGAILKITKAKNWRDVQVNPTGYWRKFKLIGGCRFLPEDWRND